MEETFVARFALLCGVSLFFSLYTWCIIRLVPAGAYRFVASIPIFIFTFIPSTLFHKDSSSEAILYYYCVTDYIWLLNLKIVAFILNRGPLVVVQRHPLLFSWVLLFPINVEQHNGRKQSFLSPNTAQQLLKSLVYEVLGCVCFAHGVLVFWEYGILRDFCLSWLMYCLLTSVMELASYVSLLVLGIQLVPHFDKPWLTTSVSEFWSSRWNLVIGALLRDLIYDPILEGILMHSTETLVKKHHPVRQVLAVFCTFLSSGIMHWLVIFYIVHIYAWMNFLAFLVHGSVVILERCFFLALHRSSTLTNLWDKIPWMVKAFCSQATIHCIAHRFFWADLIPLKETKQLVQTIDILSRN